MSKVKRSGKLIAILMVLLTCLAFSPWATNAGKAEAATNPTTLWNTSGSWIAQNYIICDITKVEVSGVGVDHFDWTDSTTCDVVLDSSTRKEASFALNITKSGWSNAGVKINGANNPAGSISHEVELSEGAKTITLQPYYSNKTGTLKTFNFTVEGGGQETLWDVTLGSGTGYTLSPVGDSSSPVANKGSYTFQLDISDGYKRGANFAVKVNGTEVELDDNNQYTISEIKANQEVTVEDVVSADTVNQYNVALTEANGVTYTPINGSASPVDEGNDFKFKVSLATGFRASASFAVNDNGTAMTADADDVYTISNIRGHHTITVTGVTQLASVKAPTGSTVSAGTFGDYFVYTWKDPAFTEDNGDGTTTYWFEPISGTTFYRVQHPDGVTYWDYQAMTAGNAYTVTEADMHMDDGDFNSDTIYHDFHYNYLDLSDMYLNINERNYLSLNQGGTQTLSVFRNWQAIESFTNAKIAAPDVHYEIVDVEGNPSDLVTVTPDSHNSGYATIAASNSGTGMAIIKITYDAMIHKQGYPSGYGAGGADPTRFGATWPECTGIIVVTVGQNGSAIDMGMTINTGGPMAHAGKVAGDKIDAEHDLLYYFDDEGAEYTFKPVDGSTVSIARCTVGTKDLSFNGFTTDGVMTDDDGNVTVTGLTAGRHIVKVEKGGVANYQVLSARHVTIAAKDAEGNEIDDWQTRWFAPGDTIQFTLHNVNSPQEKLQGCYNNSFTVYYVGENGNRLEYSMNGSEHGYGQYNFSSLDNTITVKIPDDWTDKKTYSAEHGAIAMTGFSGTAAGGHRAKSFGTATGMATGTAGTGVLGKLPDITVKVDSKPYVIKGLTNPVTKSANAGEAFTLDLSKVFTDDNGDDLTYKVSINGGDPVAADEAYECTFDTAGVYNLEFKANDGVYDSDDSYKVVLKVGQNNTSPTRKEGVEATVNETIGQDGQYELDLSGIFEDADEDNLSYSVSVNGANSESAAVNYVYKPDSAGNVKLVFRANDGTVDSTDTYTVKLKVLEGVDPGIYWDNAKDGNGWTGRSATYCYVTKVSSSGVRVKEFEWADTTCDIVLISATPEDATFDFTVTNYARTATTAGVWVNGTNSSGGSRTIQVQLVNGEASVTVQPWGTNANNYKGTLKTFNFRIADAPTNEPPRRKAGVNAEVNAEVEEGEAYSVDLSDIFEDPDGDDLTYTVSVNDAEPVTADEDYSYTPDVAVQVKLVFKAKDSKAESTDTYTVNITVNEHVHDWSVPEHAWNDDNSKVTAVRICGENPTHIETETVDTSLEVTKKATCTAPGETTYTATFENEAFEKQIKVDDTKPEALGHNKEAHEEVAATCTTAGSRAYWSCDRCGKFFEDEACEHEIEENSWVIDIDPNAHSWGDPSYEWAADNRSVTATRICEHDSSHKEIETAKTNFQEKIPATCSSKGVNTYAATFKNKAFSVEPKDVDDIPIDENAHKWGEFTEAEDSTCVKKGQNVRVCEYNEEHKDYEDLDLLDHRLTKTNRVEATCSKEGNIEYWTCSGCNQYFSDENGQTVITEADTKIPLDENAHKWKEGEGTTPSSCTSEGVKTFTCQHDKTHTRNEPVDKVPHTIAEVGAKEEMCTDNGCEAHYKCEKCSTLFADENGENVITAEDVKIPATGHKWGGWKVTKKATETAAGQKTHTCSVCKATEKEVIPKAKAAKAPTGKVTILNTIANSTKKTNDVIWDKSKVKGADAYEINWRAKGASKWTSRTVGNTVRGTTNGLSIKGLYEIRVRPVKKAANTSTYITKDKYGAWSNTVYRYFHTTEKIRLASKSKGSFTMSWNKNPEATGYQVMFTTNSNGSGAANNINTVGKDATSFTKSGLKSGTTYYVQVREIKKVGNNTYIGNISCPVAIKVK